MCDTKYLKAATVQDKNLIGGRGAVVAMAAPKVLRWRPSHDDFGRIKIFMDGELQFSVKKSTKSMAQF